MGKSKYFCVVLLLMCLFHFSCTEKNETIINSEPLDYFTDEVCDLGLPQTIGLLKGVEASEIVVVDSLVIVSSTQNDSFLFSYNIANGVINSHINKGRASNEASNILKIYVNKRREVVAYLYPNGFFLFNVDDLRNGTKNPDRIIESAIEPFNNSVIVNDASIFSLAKNIDDKENKTMFALEDIGSNNIEYFGNFPKDDQVLSTIPMEDYSRQTAYQSIVSIKPDGTKVVVVYHYGVAFSIVDCSNFNIDDHYYYYPQVTCKHIAELSANFINLAEGAKSGFRKVFCTDDYMYFLYSVKSQAEISRYILSYDWNGKPVRRYLLDRRLAAFAVYQNYIYGVVNGEEGGEILRYAIEH